VDLQPLLIWLLGALFGSMAFFAVTVAPTVFRALPGEQAGQFLRALFPRYYVWGLLMAAAAFLASLLGHPPVSMLIFLVAALFIYARQVLMPQINRSRDAELAGEPGAGERFKRQHLASVVVNGIQIALLLAVSAYLMAW